MISLKKLKILPFLTFIVFALNSCGVTLPGGDAKKYPPDPKLRVQKNLDEGRGFKLNNAVGSIGKSGIFEFASSNELWRASLDVIDFMPLSSVNYSGGIIITDWYSTDTTSNESIKISIRFLTNEIRADALDIKVFNRKCVAQSNCAVSEESGNLIPELTAKILKMAAVYQQEKREKK